jgi:hypothetical protein
VAIERASGSVFDSWLSVRSDLHLEFIQYAHLRPQLLDLVFQPRGFSLELRRLGAVRGVEGNQVAVNALFDLLLALVDLARGEVLVAGVYSLNLLPSMATSVNDRFRLIAAVQVFQTSGGAERKLPFETLHPGICHG